MPSLIGARGIRPLAAIGADREGGGSDAGISAYPIAVPPNFMTGTGLADLEIMFPIRGFSRPDQGRRASRDQERQGGKDANPRGPLIPHFPTAIPEAGFS